MDWLSAKIETCAQILAAYKEELQLEVQELQATVVILYAWLLIYWMQLI